MVEVDDVDLAVVEVVDEAAVVEIDGDPTAGRELVVQVVDGVEYGEDFSDGNWRKRSCGDCGSPLPRSSLPLTHS